MQMIGNVFLREFSQLLLKHGASLEDIINMVYTHEELDPLTGKYKKYFDLVNVKRNSQKIPEGFSYKIRYRLDLAGNRIPQGKATFTTKTASKTEAVKLGFDNRLEVLKNYELNKGKPKGGSVFYKMLSNYYEKGSKYLEDDNINNKREVVHKSRIEAQTFIKENLIPYLQDKKIKNISEITTSVYSGFKLYLQAKGLKDKTINNRLIYLLRIFDYHIRNKLLNSLPYSKGTSLIRISGKQEKEDAEILPIEKLKCIYPHKRLIDPLVLVQFINPFAPTKTFSKLSVRERKIIFEYYIFPFTVSILALNTGMRNSEISRLKREDFIGVEERETFLLKVWNKKTEYFNKSKESKYRKIPLHHYTIEAVKFYIRRKEELYGKIGDTNFLFGKEKADIDTGEIDGFLHPKSFDKVVLLILSLIKHKDAFPEFFATDQELLEKIVDIKALHEDVKKIKEAGKGISFYSFRKTFRTMLGLSNDLAEYYMGHKLGDNSKTTYIQVNSLDNALFVDEYAEPVISMLDKYVFYTKEELKKMDEDDKAKMKAHIDYANSQINKGIPLRDVFINCTIKEALELKKKASGQSESNGYFTRI